jgi:hypothetical protein
MLTARDLTAFYVDEVRARGVTPAERDIGHLAREAKRLLDAGRDPARIHDAITQLVRAGSRPHALESYTVQSELHYAKRRSPEGRAEDAYRAFVEENGRPTGARFVRGSHSGSYVYDPLGFDAPPYDWPYARPTREEILAALRSRP